MRDEQWASDDQVLHALMRLSRRRADCLVGMDALLDLLDASREDIEPLVRDLESRGQVLCSPAAGPVAVLTVTGPEGIARVIR